MSGPEPAEIQKDSVSRMLNAGPLFVHYNHVQSGIKTARSCGVCRTGLESLYTEIEKPKPVDKGDGVPAGDGVDKERDPAHPRDFRDYTSGEADKLLE